MRHVEIVVKRPTKDELPFVARWGPRVSSVFGRRGSAGVIAFLSLALALPVVSLLPAPASATHSVVVNAPAGGEMWSGETLHDIRYTTTGSGQFDYTITYRVAGMYQGTIRWETLYEPHADPHAGVWLWTVPDQDLTDVTIRVCVEDTDAIAVCDDSAPFLIDASSPGVASRSPQGANIGRTEPITIDFTEPMDLTALEGAITINPPQGGFSLTPVNATAVQLAPFSYQEGWTYTVAISCNAVDRSEPGNTLENCPVSWAFVAATSPTISVTTPAGGERWTGGSTHLVTWSASDAEDPLGSLQVSLDISFDGTSFSPIGGPFPGDGSFASPWRRAEGPGWPSKRWRALDSNAWERSRPTTRTPRWRAITALRPLPQPISTKRAPGGMCCKNGSGSGQGCERVRSK